MPESLVASAFAIQNFMALVTLTMVETVPGVALKVLEWNSGRKGNLSPYLPGGFMTFVPYLVFYLLKI